MSLDCKILNRYGLSDIIPFGRYKGKSVKEVLELRPSWLVWAHEEIDTFNLSKKAVKLAKERDTTKRFEWFDGPDLYCDYFWK